MAVHGFGWPRWSAREHVEHQGRAPFRRGVVAVARTPPAGAALGQARSGRARDRVGAPLATPKPRAGPRALAIAARGGAAHRSQAVLDQAVARARRSVASTRSATTATSSGAGAARRARSRRVHAFADSLLVIVGVLAIGFVLDAAVRTFVVPAWNSGLVHGRGLPGHAARVRAVRVAAPGVRSPRPRHGRSTRRSRSWPSR